MHVDRQGCTVKYVHCQVCSQVLCAVDAGAAKRSIIKVIHSIRADYVCIHCQYRGCRAIVFGWQYTMRPWVAVPNEAWVTVKCVHCQVCSQVLCAVNAGAAKRSAPIGQCQCHGLDAGATKGTDAVAAKGFALWDPLPNAKAGSEPVTCFSEIVASCFPGVSLGCVRVRARSRVFAPMRYCGRMRACELRPGASW